MNALAQVERFEEAAATRDRLRSLSTALRRQRLLGWLRDAGRLRLAVHDGTTVVIDGGFLDLGELDRDAHAAERENAIGPDGVADRRFVDELLVVGRWFERALDAGSVRLVDASGAPASPRTGGLPRYEVLSRRGMRRGR
jgi:hypothetical protein